MTNLTKAQVLKVQAALNHKGFRDPLGKPLIVDGIWGPKTAFAVVNFKRSIGLRARDYVGPVTYAKLTSDAKPIADRLHPADNPPWYREMFALIGKHEVRDNAELAAWLRSDGATVGDPRLIPWCGDAVQTALRRALPDEILPTNPYAAINWASFGTPVKPQLGAILSFWRGSPTGWQGHVGFYAGESADNFYVLGGNQGDQITIAPLSKGRLRPNGSRWPTTGEAARGIIVAMTGGVVSTNEA